MNKNVHTVHNKNGWQNKYENALKPINTFSNKQKILTHFIASRLVNFKW